MTKKFLILMFWASAAAVAEAQTLSLDSCRAMALRNNKTLGVSRLKLEMAHNTAKAAKTKYLPKVDVVGGYEYMSKQVSLLNTEQKTALTSLGTSLSTGLGPDVTAAITDLAQKGVITPDQATQFGNLFNKMGTSMGGALNQVGQHIVDAFDTDTHNMFVVSAVLRQPIYMGGSIVAANRIARIGEDMAANSIASTTQSTLYDIDNTYWTVVSLRHKLRLANSFLELVTKLDGDVHKMIKEGVATRADGLRVDVKVNEAEMAVTQAENGLSLAKMLLCQLCGLPVGSDITLADENSDDLQVPAAQTAYNVETALENRPELKLLQNAVDISQQTTTIVRAAYLPQVALTGGYLMTNPNVYNGFENKFSGVWNVGVMVRIPVWNWFEGTYKVRASKIAGSIAALELDDAREKVELQVNQSSFKVKESGRRLAIVEKNVENAEENLRCANLGFKEGVIQSTEVMEAQTAWLQAQSQRIDAKIDRILSQLSLQKSLGTLQ